MSKSNLVKFKSQLWKYQFEAATSWYFFTVPDEESFKIKCHNAFNKKAWGSVPVLVKLKESSWKTSVFPDSKSGCYILPVKAQIRKVNCLKEGDYLDVEIEVI